MSDHLIPEGWEKKDFKKVVYFQEGPGLLSPQFRDNGIPFLNIRCLSGKGVLKENLQHLDEMEVLTKYNHFLLEDNDLVVSSSGTLGRSAFIKKEDLPLMLNTSIIRMRPLDDDFLDRKFLKYYLESTHFQEDIYRLSTGSAQNNYGPSHLSKINFLLPKSIKEQLKIAVILQNVDNNIDKTQEIIEKYEIIKPGLMYDLFTKGIDENGKPHTEFKDSELCEIPTFWDEITFKSSITKILDFRGKTPKKIGMDWGGGEITALSANNVQMGKINFEKENYYGSEELYDKWMNRGNCEFKDIIMTMEAPLGNIAQIPDNRKYILSQRVILLKTNKNKIQNDYLAHYLRSNFFQDQLSKYSSGTTAKGIQQSQLLKLKILIPNSISEQFRVSEKLNSIENKIESEKRYLNKLQKIKTGLMQDLLTGKIRVQT